jgi:membrane protein YdbS with pleckstrin-like domain
MRAFGYGVAALLVSALVLALEIFAYMVIVFGGTGPAWQLVVISAVTLIVLIVSPTLICWRFWKLYRRAQQPSS